MPSLLRNEMNIVDPAFLSNARFFSDYLGSIPRAKRKELYWKHKAELFALVQSAKDFEWILKFLSNRERMDFYQAQKESLIPLIQGPLDFEAAMAWLVLLPEPSERIEMFEAVGCQKMVEWIQAAEYIEEAQDLVMRHLPKEQQDVLAEALEKAPKKEQPSTLGFSSFFFKVAPPAFFDEDIGTNSYFSCVKR